MWRKSVEGRATWRLGREPGAGGLTMELGGGMIRGPRRPMTPLETSISSILRRKRQQVWSVEPESSVYEAIEMMAERQVGALLVMAKGELRGIISERDYARKVILLGRSSKETPVAEIMSSDVITVTPEHGVGECMRLMTDHRVRHLPVLVNGMVRGLVSIGDLVNFVITEQGETIRQLEAYISGTAG